MKTATKAATKSGARAAAPPRRPALRRLVDWAAALDDGEILRTAFYGLLAVTIVVVVMDYRGLTGEPASPPPAASAPDDAPILPAFDPSAPQGKPGPLVTTDVALLRQPLALSLGPGGVLSATGTIDTGAAGRFAAELAARGEYVKTVALDSPGGSLTDALAIGRLIRRKGLGTRVVAGALCASSCPLVFAGGSRREAAAGAAIGVHQFYLTGNALETLAGAHATGAEAASLAMADAQKTAADISRYLSDMGIDPATWLHALDTPPDRLYYFTAGELISLKLATALLR